MAELGANNRSPAQATLSEEPDAQVLHITGELDIHSIENVRRTADLLVERKPEHVVIDLSDLTFMDSSGIALLLWIASKVQRVELRNPSPIIENLIALTGLTDTLPLAR